MGPFSATAPYLTFLDAETTYCIKNKIVDPTPVNPRNHMVMLGLGTVNGHNFPIGTEKHPVKDLFYVNIDCRSPQGDMITKDKKYKSGKEFLTAPEGQTYANTVTAQTILSTTSIMVIHNAKFDISWLKAIGLGYKGCLLDTMLIEYVLQGGVKESLSLEALGERYNCKTEKGTLPEALNITDREWSGLTKDEYKELTNRNYNDLLLMSEILEKQLKKLKVSYADIINQGVCKVSTDDILYDADDHTAMRSRAKRHSGVYVSPCELG